MGETKKLRLDAAPLVGVGPIAFGMTRSEVRAIWGEAKEFHKRPDSETTTDDFGFCHVFYDADGCCEAIEIWDDAEVFVDGKQVFPVPLCDALKAFPDFEEDDDGPIAAGTSVAIYAPDGEPESILFGKTGYYE